MNTEKPIEVEKIEVPPADTRSFRVIIEPFALAKREYIVTPEIDMKELAKKHDLPYEILKEVAQRENWESQKTRFFDRELEKVMLDKRKKVDEEHEKIGMLMIQSAIRSLKKNRRLVMDFKEAKDYLVEGVKLRRQALGMEKGSPKVINIINQQQAIIEKYKVKNDNL